MNHERILADLYLKRKYYYKVIQNKIKESPEDVFQLALLKFHRSCINGIYNDEKRPEAYFYTILKNQCIDFLRAKPKVDVINLDYSEVAIYVGSEEGDHVVHEELSIAINEFMKLRKPKDRVVFNLRVYGGMKFQEISDETGIHITTIKGRMWRLRKALKQYLISEGFE